MHDMQAMMKSLAHDQESMLNASRSNFHLNRSILYGDNPYNQYGSSSNFRGGGGLLGQGIGNQNGGGNLGNSMLALS